MAFNRSGATQAVALNISNDFDRVWHACFLLMECQGGYLALFLLFSVADSFQWFWMKSLEYQVNAGVPQGSILGSTLFLLYINGLPDYVICDIDIYADDTNFYSKCDQASELWEQLELASELESDL